MANELLGLSAFALFLFGAIGVMLAYGLNRVSGMPKVVPVIAGVAGGALILAGVGAAVGFGSLTAPTSGQLGAAEYDVTSSEDFAQSQVVIDNEANVVQIQMQYDISDANFIGGTGGGEVNFTIARADSGTGDAVTEVDVVSVELVPHASGDGQTEPIAAKYTDGTFKTDWEKGPNASPVVINDFTTVLVEGGSTGFVRINITLNAEAAGEMTVYDQAKISLRVAGEPWIVECLLTVKQA